MADSAQFVTLGVADDVFAAPVERVQEILDMRPIARLPQAPANLLGMIDVRGDGVPVIDLRLALGLPPIADSLTTRIVVLSVQLDGEKRLLGLRTDRVFEVTVLDSPELEPPPAIGGRWNGHAIAGIGRRHGGFVTVLDLDRLVASSGLAAAALGTPQAEPA